MKSDEIIKLESEFNDKYDFPNTWPPSRVANFNAKLLLSLSVRLARIEKALVKGNKGEK